MKQKKQTELCFGTQDLILLVLGIIIITLFSELTLFGFFNIQLFIFLLFFGITLLLSFYMDWFAQLFVLLMAIMFITCFWLFKTNLILDNFFEILILVISGMKGRFILIIIFIFYIALFLSGIILFDHKYLIISEFLLFFYCLFVGYNLWGFYTLKYLSIETLNHMDHFFILFQLFLIPFIFGNFTNGLFTFIRWNLFNVIKKIKSKPSSSLIKRKGLINNDKTTDVQNYISINKDILKKILTVHNRKFNGDEEIKKSENSRNPKKEVNMEYKNSNFQNNYGLIYKIINKINFKVYIGKTTRSLKERWKEHKISAEQNLPFPLYRAINKYGAKNFFIKIIDYGKDKNDLNKKEINWIESHKSFIGKYGGRFGYNLTPGGDGARRINISKKVLEKLIKTFLSVNEMASILDVSGKTIARNIEEKFGKTVVELRESLKIKNQFKNRISEKIIKTYINKSEIKEKVLENLIFEGLTTEEIAKKLGTYRRKIIIYTKKFWGKTINEKRKELGVYDLFKKRIIKKQVLRRYYDKTTTFRQYKKIEKENLRFLIKSGLNVKELSNELNMSNQGIRNKINEFWGISLTQLRKDLGILDEIRKIRRKKVNKSLKERSIDSKVLESRIKEGLSAREIGDKLDIHYKTVYEKISDYWNMSISKKRKELGVEELFKSRIREKMKENNIKIFIERDDFSDPILDKLKENKNGDSEIKKLQIEKRRIKPVTNKRDNKPLIHDQLEINQNKSSLDEFKINLDKLSDQSLDLNKKVKLVEKYLSQGLSLEHIAKKIKIEKRKLRDGFIPKELGMTYLDAIDIYYWKPKLLKLIEKGLHATEIGQRLGKHPTTIYKAVERVLGITLTEANEKFYWIPRLKKYLREFLSIKQIAEIMNVNEKTIRNRIKKIWNLTPKAARKKIIKKPQI